MNHRACNNIGGRFVANGHRVTFGGVPYDIPPTPNTPDMHGPLVAFASAEDIGTPEFGTWFMRSGEQPFRPTGIHWRSWWPGRFAPDGTYYMSGKRGDLGEDSGRASFWMIRTGQAAGPFATGTTNIEGISDFKADGQGGWIPMWQNRGRPLIVEINRTSYRLPLWTQAGEWLYGQMTGAYGDQHIAKDPSGVWRLVTTKTPPPIFPCVKQQQDGSLLVAWVGDKEALISSHQGWPVLVIEPPVVKPPKPPIIEPPIVIPPKPKPPTEIRSLFPKMERFMSETELVVRALQKQVNWNPNMDGRGHRAIWGSVRPDGPLVNGEGKVKIGDEVSNAPPDPHGEHPEGPQDDGSDDQTEVRLRMLPGEQGESQLQRIDIQFTNGERLQLCEMPPDSPDQFGELQTRATDAIDIQEMWNDGILGNVEQVFHLSGGALRVIR